MDKTFDANYYWAAPYPGGKFHYYANKKAICGSTFPGDVNLKWSKKSGIGTDNHCMMCVVKLVLK